MRGSTSLEGEIATLRSGYLTVNKRYDEALSTLKSLTQNALEAATRAATSAEKSTLACRNATNAAVAAASLFAFHEVDEGIKGASQYVIEATEAAALAAGLAALAASEAAAAASDAASAAASAAAVQAEETAIHASAEAARATLRATAAAAQAAQMANEAAAAAKSIRR